MSDQAYSIQIICHVFQVKLDDSTKSVQFQIIIEGDVVQQFFNSRKS